MGTHGHSPDLGNGQTPGHLPVPTAAQNGNGTGGVPVPQADGFEPGRWARARHGPSVPGSAQRRRREGLPPGSSPGVRAVLVAIVAAVIAVQVVGLVLLWPRGAPPAVPRAANPYDGVTFLQGRVTAVSHRTCDGDPATDRASDSSVPSTVSCTYAAVTVAGRAGPHVSVGVPPQVGASGVRVGDQLQLIRYPPALAGAGPTYAFVDFARGVPLALLAALFAVLVLVVARWRGLASLAGLALAFLVIGVFVLPGLRRGESPLLVAAVGAGAVMTVILPMAHGFSGKTISALLGTLAGVWTAAGLGAWVSAAAHLNGLGGEERLALSRLTTGGDLSGIVLAGVVLAGLGVLNDVTITQASAVWELREHAPQLSPAGLFASAMRIGRDHLSSTIYTLAFAYAGLALPTLLLDNVYGEPLRQLITSNEVGEEIGRTLVASTALVLAIPLTTAIAVLLAYRLIGAPGDRPGPDGVPVGPPSRRTARRALR